MGFGFPFDLIVSLALLASCSLCAIDYFLRIMKYFRKETNGDHIRNMTNEELAKILYCGIPSICKICKAAPEDEVIAPILEFLNSEYVPDDDEERGE